MLIYQGKDVLLSTPAKPRIISVGSLEQSKYITLHRVIFEEQGKRKEWDIAKSHDSVAIVLYHKDRDGFIFVRQFRVSVFLQNERHGYMYELCAGLCDKNVDIMQTVIEELQEECGYFLSGDNIIPIAEFYSSVGMNGAKQHLFYAEVSSQDKRAFGGGLANENENIELIFVPRALISEFLDDVNCPKTPSLCYGILWSQSKILSKVF
ncbi:NUDIX hydrolase [Helicobacter aurati]|uniref:NUDIX hydrolase n=2 Tax=Helicobacter aurati TaxID=137778 RepID=A0A3D8J673_9HELI|nr:NUDIX hydrolase [Helicobacter aurati]